MVLITACIGIPIMSWKLLEDYSFIIRRRNLKVEDLYRRGGVYEYKGGFNPRAILSLASGVFVALIGLFVSELRFLYDYAGIVGFGTAFVMYVIIIQCVAMMIR